MLFKEIPGHQLLKESLMKSSLSDRVSHAMLFLGPEGNAGFPLAMAFAQYLNCTGDRAGDSCGVCPSCLKAARLIHPDIHYIFPVTTGKKAKTEPYSELFLEEWRAYIGDFAYPGIQSWMALLDTENKQAGIYAREAMELLRRMSLKAFESEYKVVLIWLPEKMNAPAANKLLKILEEPPPHTVFLLIAEQTQSMLPTILSRVQLVRVPPFRDEELLPILKASWPDKEKEISEVLPLSEGNVLNAVKMLHTDDQLNYNRENFILWMRMSYGYKAHELLDWVSGVAGLSRERQKSFLTYCLQMIRENYLMNNSLETLTRMNTTEKDFSVKFSQFIHTGNIGDLLEIFSRGIRQIEMNAMPRPLFMDMSHELYRALRIKKPA